jgi:glycosyltransferase involved in cell wall biosynthesis
MKTRISAIIIDPLKDEHNYDEVNIENDYLYYRPYGEIGFDISVVKSADNINSTLNLNRGFDCLITLGEGIDFAQLNNLSFEFRKKWIHMDEFNPKEMAHNIIDVFLYNINRERPQEVKLFSIFTCTYNTSNEMFNRLYNSLKAQTYKNWNWYILDDSPLGVVAEKLKNVHDPRITVFTNVTNHGNIGFNKRTIAMACDGDYLVEVDHDDELTPDCLSLLNKAFEEFPNTDFVYSHAMEEIDGHEVNYGNDFAYGLGEYRLMNVLGVERNIALTADINALSVRGIHALPNHVRCWSASFYRKIGGHNPELAVLDDMDILIRTFLYGKMTKVDKVLYIQHEGTTAYSTRGTTTQAARFKEIQRTNELLRWKYDDQIHYRVLELCGEDPFWINEDAKSNIRLPHEKLPIFNNILYVNE